MGGGLDASDLGIELEGLTTDNTFDYLTVTLKDNGSGKGILVLDGTLGVFSYKEASGIGAAGTVWITPPDGMVTYGTWGLPGLSLTHNSNGSYLSVAGPNRGMIQIDVINSNHSTGSFVLDFDSVEITVTTS